MNEDEFVDTVFRLNVKGMTQFGSGFVVSGRITAAADGTSSKITIAAVASVLMSRFLFEGSTDFQQLAPIIFTNTADIRLFTSNDDVCLEYDDRVHLIFTPDNPGLITGVESFGEYIRNIATVHIIDNDCKHFWSTEW